LLIIGLVMYILTRRGSSARNYIDNIHILAFCLAMFGVAAVVSVPVSLAVDRRNQFLVSALGVAVPYTVTLSTNLMLLGGNPGANQSLL